MEQLADGFWNCRGSFRIGGILDVGTQMSVVRRGNGRFLVLDSYELGESAKAALVRLTDHGRLIDAIINLHPFHTLHCDALHAWFPQARLIGTRRHHKQLPNLPWADDAIEDAATQDMFADDLDFAMPDGTDLVTADDRVHAASVLARHRRTGIVHVDDTLMVLAAPGRLGAMLPQSTLRFHPMLSKALRPGAGAADAFAAWVRDLAARWADTPIVCAAHSAVRRLPPGGWQDEVLGALARVGPVLARHRETCG
jgi:hypothetical protein